VSIYAYTGLPGSGKSYGVVANQILPALSDGRVVSTNIPLNVEAIRKRTQNGTILEFPTSSVAEDPARIEEFAPAGCLLVIDELWKLFPAGQKVDKVPESFKRLLAEHRHMVDAKGRSTQIVFVTQDLAQISAFARQLVEQTYHHTKLGHLGLSGSYQVRTYHGAVTGSNPPVQNQLHKAVGRYKADIFACYQSHTMSQSATSGADENPLDGRGVFWKRPSIWDGALLVVGVVSWALPTALQALSFGGEDVAPSGRIRKGEGVELDGLADQVGQTEEPGQQARHSGEAAEDL